MAEVPLCTAGIVSLTKLTVLPSCLYKVAEVLLCTAGIVLLTEVTVLLTKVAVLLTEVTVLLTKVTVILTEITVLLTKVAVLLTCLYKVAEVLLCTAGRHTHVSDERCQRNRKR